MAGLVASGDVRRPATIRYVPDTRLQRLREAPDPKGSVVRKLQHLRQLRTLRTARIVHVVRNLLGALGRNVINHADKSGNIPAPSLMRRHERIEIAS